MNTRLKKSDIDSLREVVRISKMETCNFGHPGDGEIVLNGLKEVDEFVKERVRLWVKSWINSPLSEILSNIEEGAK